MSVTPSSAPSPANLVSRPLPCPPALRALRPAIMAIATCLVLSTYATHMDMTIRSQGSYDVIPETHDTSGTAFLKGRAPGCSTYSDPTALGVPEGITVKATPITSDDGIGCQVSTSGVKVPQTSQAEPNATVVRDGEVYKVTIQPFPSGPSQDTDGAAGAQNSASQAPVAPSGDSGNSGGAQLSNTSFKGPVDTKVSVTLPDAVTQSGGGKVSGTTVTQDDPDTMTRGVNASDYAQSSQGVSWWTRSRIWLTAGLALFGGVLTMAVPRRRSSGHAPRQTVSGQH